MNNMIDKLMKINPNIKAEKFQINDKKYKNKDFEIENDEENFIVTPIINEKEEKEDLNKFICVLKVF
jgi:hypothetical protein